MVTAYGHEDVIQLSEQAGAEGFLVKPVSPSTLLDTILSVLGRGRIFGTADTRHEKMADLAVSGKLAGARVLLVEDNDINREFVVELLRSEGIVVDEAVNGVQAADRVRQQDYDAVLMDIQMPVMDGLEATRRIRALAEVPGGERFARLPIIAMTALAMAKDSEQSRAAGMNDHVTKPIDPDRLMAALANLVHLPAGRADKAARTAVEVVPRTNEIPPDLQALTSLDAREGVRRIGGKADAYRKQLRRFREHYSDAATQLQRLAAERDVRQAEEYCHALKGVVGSIGAQALYGKVAAIDVGLKQGTLPEAAELDALRTLLEQVLHDIASLDSGSAAPTPAVTPLAPDRLRDRLERLAHVLAYDLGAAEPLLAELREGVAGTSLETSIASIAALVDVFDIDTALEQLSALEIPGPGNPS
jgi:CheY-like chemotaxis protein/HPt (histidine-containing phosphotransfer) domain-containing protein